METRVEKKLVFRSTKNVLYLMKRDFRINENYSIILSQDLSEESKSEMYILANLDLYNENFNLRQKYFITEGLREMTTACDKLNFHIIFNEKYEDVIDKFNIDCIITEFSPLKSDIELHNELMKFCKSREISFYICDSHNIVPCTIIDKYCKSGKSVKSRLYEHWQFYFNEFPKTKKHFFNKKVSNSNLKLKNYCENENLKKIPRGGYNAGMNELDIFIKERFPHFKKHRNNADKNMTSRLSPYILSGQISSQEVLLKICKLFDSENENLEDFINEVFVWKETGEHYCYFENNYDNIDGASEWAKDTLNSHLKDKRHKIYTDSDLEKALTDDDEWNAGMNELKETGDMHLYVFLYWCKKILFFTSDPEKALKVTYNLFNKYSLNANYPYSILWIMYCICGVMDRGFAEQSIIGKIRSIKSIKADDYVKKWTL